jgi:hypothetical protein
MPGNLEIERSKADTPSTGTVGYRFEPGNPLARASEAVSDRSPKP